MLSVIVEVARDDYETVWPVRMLHIHGQFVTTSVSKFLDSREKNAVSTIGGGKIRVKRKIKE